MSSETLMTHLELSAAKAEIMNEVASMKERAQVQRKIELSRLYRKFRRHGWTLDEIAEQEGISRQSVVQIIRFGENEERRSR